MIIFWYHLIILNEIHCFFTDVFNLNISIFISFTGSLLPEDCEWSDWGPWTQCSVTCSQRSPKSLSSDSRETRLSQDIGTQQRIRTIQKQPKYGGRPCDELRDGVQLIRCRAESPCATRNEVPDETIPEYEGKKIIRLYIFTILHEGIRRKY